MPRPKFSSAWIGTYLGLVCILLIIGLTVELNKLSYALDAQGLVGLCFKVGIAMTFLSGLIVWDRKKWDQATRLKAIALSALACFILGGWLTLLSNRLPAHLRQSKIISVEMMEEEAFFQGGVVISPEQAAGPPDRYLSTFRHEGEVYQLSLDQPLFPNREVGERVDLEIVTGLWGYRYILPPQ